MCLSQAHKLILSACSPYFRALLRKEQMGKSSPFISFGDVDFLVVKMFILNLCFIRYRFTSPWITRLTPGRLFYSICL